MRTAPPHSPPTAMPCSNRQATNRIGAATPILGFERHPVSAYRGGIRFFEIQFHASIVDGLPTQNPMRDHRARFAAACLLPKHGLTHIDGAMPARAPNKAGHQGCIRLRSASEFPTGAHIQTASSKCFSHRMVFAGALAALATHLKKTFGNFFGCDIYRTL